MRRDLATLSLIALLGVLVSACGGGGGGGGATSEPTPPNTAPVASFTVSQSAGTLPLTVQFDASASSDADGSIANYNWNFGDGTAASAGVVATHLYQTAGAFTATLTVTDNRGATGSTARTVTVAAPPPIKATLRAPKAGGLVSDAVSVVVSVDSTYEVSSVTASLAGSQVSLTYAAEAYQCTSGTSCPGFVGMLSLSGQPTGTYTLKIRATDARGNVDELSADVIHDNPPVLTIAEPVDLSVALPTVPMDARCSDDLPGCQVELLVDDQFNRTAPAALTGTLDLTAYVGKAVTLRFRARDSASQLVYEDRTVYVEDRTRLTVVGEARGLILDVNARRMLVVESAEATDLLNIYDRSTGAVERIPLPDGLSVSQTSAYLTEGGAIFVTQQRGGTVLSSRLYLWKLGTLTDLGYPNSAASLAVNGAYAIWNVSTDLYRINTSTGISALVASDAGNWMNSVAADGTVVYWSRAYQIIKNSAGQATALTSDTTQWHVWPVTDGNDVVYREQDPCCVNQQFAIVMITGGSQIPLAAKRPQEPYQGRDYQLDGGWVAYTDLGTQEQLHVFTRSPLGAVTRHTDLASSSYIDRLGGNGEVMITNGSTRYFSRGAGVVAVSSSSGKSYWIDGSWFVAIGRALLAVDTRG